MLGETLIYIQRNGKDICILLKEGEALTLENIVDVWVLDPQDEKQKEEKC